jgi:hypothetical protein
MNLAEMVGVDLEAAGKSTISELLLARAKVLLINL